MRPDRTHPNLRPLPGLAANPAALPPLRPSYTRHVRALEHAATWAGVAVRDLTDDHLNRYAAHRKWAHTTHVTMTRVAAIHGLTITELDGYQPAAKPAGLSTTTTTQPDDNAIIIRAATWARLSWHWPASHSKWRDLTFNDLTITDPDTIIDARTAPGSAELVTAWSTICQHLHPDTDPAQLPVLCRIDAPLPLSPRGAANAWRTWAQINGFNHTYDQWRRWSIESGTKPVDRFWTRNIPNRAPN